MNKVSIVIPSFSCTEYIARAVQSILMQTYSNITVYIVSDGEATPPWNELAQFDDPRLIRIELTKNMGCFYAMEVVLRATQDKYLAIQDADDWSELTRIETLYSEIRTRPLTLSTSAHIVHNGGHISYEDMSKRLHSPFRVDDTRNRVRYHGVYDVAKMKQLGGFYGGFRIGFDRYIVNMLHALNEVGYLESPLYHKLERSDSLGFNNQNGMGTAQWKQVDAILTRMWQQLCKELGSVRTQKQIQTNAARILQSNVTEYDNASLNRLAREIKGWKLESGGIITLSP